MAPADVSPANVYTVWQRLNNLQARIPIGQVKFKVVDHVRISKQKVLFAKGYEKSYSTEIFRVAQVIKRKLQPVYLLSDLLDRPVEWQFYNYELVKVTLTPGTEFQIDKIVRRRNKNGIKQHLVTWKGYDETFNSWINAGDINNL
jgi:hypothetical protein